MTPVELSAVRRFLLWWFRPPRSQPWVSVSASIDYEPALAYLAGLKGGPRVTVNHLFVAAVARVLSEFPVANRRVVGGRIFQLPSVGVAAPVNLLGTDSPLEVTMMGLNEVESMSLRDIADATTKTVQSERGGSPTLPAVKLLVGMMKHLPTRATHVGFRAAGRVAHTPALAGAVHKLVGVSTVITNPGSAMRDTEGLLFRGGAINLPDNLIHVGTLWGLGSLQPEVRALGDDATVRRCLPFSFVFDHRLFDGVMAGRIVTRLNAIHRDPGAVFGEDGRVPVGELPPAM
jgi:pyruvate/2-oxoglutarate dehydrogenase complex dihydrolipoamide acyltransferase (E2) component